WKTSHPITLKPRDMGFDPTGQGWKDRPNLWTYRRIADRENFAPNTYPGDICLVNWPQNDYWLGNLYEVPYLEAAGHLERAKVLGCGRPPWRKREPPGPEGRRGWKGLGLRPDVMGPDHGLAMAPYVREPRRIQAMFTVTENHVGTDARAKKLG